MTPTPLGSSDPFARHALRRGRFRQAATVVLLGFGLQLRADDPPLNLSATRDQTLVIEDPAALAADTTITWADQDAAVWANAPIDQTFVDRFVPLSDPVSRGFLNVRSDISSDLDFTGKGDIALAGRWGWDVDFSGQWTPNGSQYRVARGDLTLTGTNQLTDIDGANARSLIVENAVLTITGAQSFTGGVTLTSGYSLGSSYSGGSSGQLRLSQADSIGASGQITMLDDGSTPPVLTLDFAADQTFLNRVVAPTEAGKLAIVQLGVSNANNLDLSAVGNVALSGTASSVVYSGAWTPGGDNVYRVQSGALTLGGTNQLTDADVDTARSLEVSGGILKITNTHDYSGGTTLKSGAMVAVAATNSLGTGAISLESGSRVQANFAVDQSFLNRITGPSESNGLAVLQLGASTSADLDFTGRGQIALAGRTTELGSAEGGATFGGTWTPSDDVYRVVGQEGSWIFTSENWNGSDQALLTLTKTNALSDDGLTARRLDVGENAILDLRAANSYTGGTRIHGDSFNQNTAVRAGATGALGSGDVAVETGGALIVYGTGGGAVISNSITLSTPGESTPGGGLLIISDGANVSGTVSMLRTGINRAEYEEVPVFTMWSGEFSGTLVAQGTGNLDLSGGVFSGSLQMAAGADVRVDLSGDMEIVSDLTITHGNQLITGGATMFGDLTLQSGAMLSYGGGSINFAGSGSVYLGNAWFDVASIVDYVPDGGTWATALLNQSTIEYQLMRIYGVFIETSPGEYEFAEGTGSINGTLRSLNLVEGYNVAFELRNEGRELFAVVTATSAIPEPSTYAALAGAAALGLAFWRRRQRIAWRTAGAVAGPGAHRGRAAHCAGRRPEV